MSTAALKCLKALGITPKVHRYKYIEHGGTAASSSALGVDEHQIIKTLVFETDTGSPFIILMHGDHTVHAKSLAREIGARSVKPCDPKQAQRHSGYLVGGTSPFGTKRHMPIYIEATILDLQRLVINAGRRGMLMELSPEVLVETLSPTRVRVGLKKT